MQKKIIIVKSISNVNNSAKFVSSIAAIVIMNVKKRVHHYEQHIIAFSTVTLLKQKHPQYTTTSIKL